MNKKIDIILQKHIDSYSVKKKFYSKKNEVYLIDVEKSDGQNMLCIFKKYIECTGNKSKETFLLKILRENGLSVPRIYFEGVDYVLLEYLAGDTLLDTIINLEKNQGESFDYERNYIVLFNVFKWLQSLHRITKDTMGRGYIFGDMNFRNFIINDEVYGIDLEDCNCRGYKEQDGGRFCAFLLTYAPIFTKWKLLATKQSVEIMTEEFGYDIHLLKNEIEKELSEINKRRGIKIPYDVIEKILY
ncbi:BUD32 family EKC/KEOPS complex subunit [Paramaledivibacter caminithermalis]|uniref:RIO1 family protein n=1 Tax=Paramaledivibacter caminithermalis (strain DSM 15212 / CIP 107654 / DViRD3) TaxID=1121301 RepID=A0A1M6QT09_PARC5|nr:hypothetical protein [Paramaledivibacter caminithermalis]SHK23295.1 hypothetical protein SAMN02745912_02713 [Paramaledivibacter caminithermalis DSM 15212]